MCKEFEYLAAAVRQLAEECGVDPAFDPTKQIKDIGEHILGLSSHVRRLGAINEALRALIVSRKNFEDALEASVQSPAP